MSSLAVACILLHPQYHLCSIMSDRGGRGGSSRGGRGGAGGGRGGGASGGPRGGDDRQDKRREAILDLSKYADKRIRVKFSGGREIEGTLKGWDQLLNLVLDDIEELLVEEGTETTPRKERKRSVGLAVIRGTSLVVINPVEGFESIANPFLQEE